MKNNAVTLKNIKEELNKTGINLKNRILNFVNELEIKIEIADKCLRIIEETEWEVRWDAFIDLSKMFGIGNNNPSDFDNFGLIRNRNPELYEKIVAMIEEASNNFKAKELTKLFFGDFYDNFAIQHFFNEVVDLDKRIIRPFFYSTISRLLLDDEYAKFILNL